MPSELSLPWSSPILVLDPAAGAKAAVDPHMYHVHVGPSMISPMGGTGTKLPWCREYHSDGNCQSLDLPPGLRGRGPSEPFSSWSFQILLACFLRHPFIKDGHCSLAGVRGNCWAVPYLDASSHSVILRSSIVVESC